MMSLEARFETTQETAQRLDVAPVTVCRWCREGRFPGAAKFARAWYIPRGLHPRRRGSDVGIVSSKFEYETTTEAARRLGLSVVYVIKLVEAGLLEGTRGPWLSYAIPKGAEPIISILDRMSRRPDTLLARRMRLATREDKRACTSSAATALQEA